MVSLPVLRLQDLPFLPAQAVHGIQIITGIYISCTAAAPTGKQAIAIHIFQYQASVRPATRAGVAAFLSRTRRQGSRAAPAFSAPTFIDQIDILRERKNRLLVCLVNHKHCFKRRSFYNCQTLLDRRLRTNGKRRGCNDRRWRFDSNAIKERAFKKIIFLHFMLHVIERRASTTVAFMIDSAKETVFAPPIALSLTIDTYICNATCFWLECRGRGKCRRKLVCWHGRPAYIPLRPHLPLKDTAWTSTNAHSLRHLSGHPIREASSRP